MSGFSKGFRTRRPSKAFHDPAYAGPFWVYFSILCAWIADLLPVSQWPFFPSFVVLALIFWSIYQPQRIFYWLAFVLGLLTDADTGAVFGQHALTYCCVVFFTELMSVRLLWLSWIAQGVSLIPIFAIPPVLLSVETFCFGPAEINWLWYVKILIAVLIWPLWSWLLSRRFYPNTA